LLFVFSLNLADRFVLTGSYTFAKTLEYQAKQNMNAGEEFTVIPPTEYQEKFVTALDGYFLARPGVLISLFHKRLFIHSYLINSRT
jgi:hypothetical protein